MQVDNLRVQSVEQQRYILEKSSFGYDPQSKMRFLYCDSEDPVEVAQYFGQWLPELSVLAGDDSVYNKISDILAALNNRGIEITEFGAVWEYK